MIRTIAIVGGGLGALRTAEALRQFGWTEHICVISSEGTMPYTRPPLSKQFLEGTGEFSEVAFTPKESVSDVEWIVGDAAHRVDLAAREITTESGRRIRFDGLVAATGVSARRLPLPGPTEGRLSLRTVDDARHVLSAIREKKRLVVIGAGFIGCEIAATARKHGCEVDVVAFDAVAMNIPLGGEVGSAIQARHETSGVRFHMGRTVHSIEGSERVSAVTLDDGTHLDADLVIEAIGSVPNVAWLEGNGLDLTNGVLCDEELRMGDITAAVAVGDVARFPLPSSNGQALRIEHWQMAGDTARHAARTLLRDLGALDEPGTPFDALASFWSDQGETSINSFGLIALADRTEVIEGSLEDDAAVAYYAGERVVGVVLLGMKRRLPFYRRWLLEQAAPALVAA